MIVSFNRLFHRAIPALAVGVALLFLVPGCRPKLPPPEKAPEEEVLPPGEEAFREALQYERLGETERAYEAYNAYVKARPAGDKARQALYRMARIRYGDRRFDDALSLFERVVREFPAHPERPQVELDILNTLYRQEALEACRSRARAWLERNPGSDLEGDVRFLLGKCEKQAGRPAAAFNQWIQAAALLSESPESLAALDGAVRELIEQAPLERLKAMAGQRKANPYLPDILHRVALLHAERGELLEAKSAAMALLDSTTSPEWRLEGRRILARLDEELSVQRDRIGCLLPLSGPFAIYGEDALNGIQMGTAAWLSGPGEPEIELIIRDTRGDATAAVQAVEELVLEARVMAIIGPLSSKVAEAAAAKAQSMGVPIITLAQQESIPTIGDMVFRNFLTPSMEVEALLEHAFYHLGLRRFGILYPDNPYGRYFMNLFWDRLEELGGTVTAAEAYPPNKTDYADEVRKMVGLYYPRPPSVIRMLEQMKAESGVTETEESDEPEPIVDFEAVFIPDNSERVALIAPQFPFHRVLGMQLLGTSLWQSDVLLEQAEDYVQRAVFPSGFFREQEREPVPSFVARYGRAFGKAPDLLAANGYDTARFLKKVLAEGRVQTRKDLRRALLEQDGIDGVTGAIRFDAEGEVLKRPVLLTVKRDAFLPVSFEETEGEPMGGRQDAAVSEASRDLD